MGIEASTSAPVSRDDLYREVIRELGRTIDRLAAGYEADPAKRLDLRQEIHLQLWRSLQVFDGRCSLKTWALRVAHNTATSYAHREQRFTTRFVSLEELERKASANDASPDLDRRPALDRLTLLIHALKPLDRQIMISYLEELDMATIADLTGLTPANVAMKIHRIKNVLARRFRKEDGHA